MREFHEFITVEGEILFFYFSRTTIAAGEEFFVSVFRSHQVFSFDMQKDDSGKWKITTLVPDWLKATEEQLSRAINNNTR